MKFRAAFIVAVVLPFCPCVVVFRCCAADTSFVEEKCSIRAWSYENSPVICVRFVFASCVASFSLVKLYIKLYIRAMAQKNERKIPSRHDQSEFKGHLI